MLQNVLVKFPRRLWTVKTNLISRKLHSQLFHIHPEVRAALANEMPVVALESTIITHGMPYPVNLETALNVENVIRSQGAIPATVAILKGKVHIGLQEEQLRVLAEKKEPCMKTSRRDLPYVISQNLNGGTTVSGTMLIAHKAGIPIFVTGGIGGVHRGAERTMDVSADLTELGRTPVAVISSGVKSILDIGKTLEYLETQGVCVATLGPSNAFPAFFSATSAFKSPAHVASPQEAACLLHAHFGLQTESGVLLAVPMPPGHEVLAARVEDVIARAVLEAEEQHIQGRDVTPFLLSRVNELTKGQSLKANIVLIENNAKVGGQVAVDLANLRHKNSFLPPNSAFSPQTHTGDSSHNDPIPRPVVLGGSIVDFVATVREDAIRMDASTHRGTIRQSYGGVGRNLADVLTRLGMKPLLLTSVGQDSLGQDLMGHNPQLKTSGFCRVPTKATATYVVILDKKGQFQFGIGDLDVHQDLTVEWVRRYAKEIRSAPLVVMDGNTPQATMDYVLDMCEESQTPVWFEPTDTNKAKKPFHSHRWKTIKFSSPNLAELQVMSDSLHRRDTAHSPLLSWPELQEWVVEVSLPLLEHMQCLMVTLGKQGMLILRHEDSKHSLWPPRKILQKDRSSLTKTHYPAPSVEDKNVVSVSGAGDCLASGFMAGMLCGMSQDTCAALALETASRSLLASPAVPCTITEDLILKYVIGKTQS